MAKLAVEMERRGKVIPVGGPRKLVLARGVFGCPAEGAQGGRKGGAARLFVEAVGDYFQLRRVPRLPRGARAQPRRADLTFDRPTGAGCSWSKSVKGGTGAALLRRVRGSTRASARSHASVNLGAVSQPSRDQSTPAQSVNSRGARLAVEVAEEIDLGERPRLPRPLLSTNRTRPPRLPSTNGTPPTQVESVPCSHITKRPGPASWK